MLVRGHHLRQTATLWRLTGLRDTYGAPTFVAPVIIQVRWSQGAEQITTPAGEKVVSLATVHLLDTQAVAEGDWLYLGKSSKAAPGDQDSAYEVIRALEIPRLLSTGSVRKVFL